MAEHDASIWFTLARGADAEDGLIMIVQEVDDLHVMLLAMPVAPADGPLDWLWILQQVELDDHRGELERGVSFGNHSVMHRKRGVG